MSFASANVAASGVTSATSTTTGALQTAGGLGVAGNAYIGGIASIEHTTANALRFTGETAGIQFNHASAHTLSSDGALTVSTTAGAIVVNPTTDLDVTAATFDVNASGAIELDAAASSNLTVTGSGQDLTLEATGGGATQVIVQSAGTGADALRLNASAGGIDVDAALASRITVTGSGQNLTLEATGGGATQTHLRSAGTGDSAIRIVATAGGVDVDAEGGVAINAITESNLSVTGANQHLRVEAKGGGLQQLFLTSAGTHTDALRLNASAGGMDVDVETSLTMHSKAASIINVTSADLTLSTTTSGDLTLSTTTSGTIALSSAGSLTVAASDTTVSSGAVEIQDTTTASSTTTGALQVAGGVGIAENLHVGGNAVITGVVSGAGLTLTSGDLTSTFGDVDWDLTPHNSAALEIMDNDVAMMTFDTSISQINMGVKIDMGSKEIKNIQRLRHDAAASIYSASWSNATGQHVMEDDYTFYYFNITGTANEVQLLLPDDLTTLGSGRVIHVSIKNDPSNNTVRITQDRIADAVADYVVVGAGERWAGSFFSTATEWVPMSTGATMVMPV